MKNSFGTSLTITLFGESHGPSVGAVLDGVAPGIEIDEDYIKAKLELRRPLSAISTSRQESDPFVFESGVFEGRTIGTPLVVRIPNTDTRSADYASTRFLARPSHADFTAFSKYHGFEDFRGGGHFSGRITSALVAAGAIVMSALEKKGIYIGTHLSRCAGIVDRDFSEDIENEVKAVSTSNVPVLDKPVFEKMEQAILEAKGEGDSVGGVLETAVVGLPAGLGEPWFDTVEGVLSHALFSIPAVKGVEFGLGFALADLKGSVANDPFVMKNGKVATLTNNSGGINGGITNGMPVVFRTVVRPTPTISQEQKTVDMSKMEDATLASKGRHDPCILPRARVVQDCVTALVIYDLMAGRFGTDWAVEK